MFSISFDAGAAMDTLSSMIDEQLKTLPNEMKQELVDWQVEDMHRHFPKVDGDDSEVYTMIYPRSQLTRIKNIPSSAKVIRRRSRVAIGRSGGVKRPILRPVLYDQLKSRMEEMLKETLQWH